MMTMRHLRFRMFNSRRAHVLLALTFALALAFMLARPAQAQTHTKAHYVTFDIKGALQTTGGSINDNGYIAGWYMDSLKKNHGIFCAPDGKITIFNVSGATDTYGNSINIKNVITGEYFAVNGFLLVITQEKNEKGEREFIHRFLTDAQKEKLREQAKQKGQQLIEMGPGDPVTAEVHIGGDLMVIGSPEGLRTAAKIAYVGARPVHSQSYLSDHTVPKAALPPS